MISTEIKVLPDDYITPALGVMRGSQLKSTHSRLLNHCPATLTTSTHLQQTTQHSQNQLPFKEPLSSFTTTNLQQKDDKCLNFMKTMSMVVGKQGLRSRQKQRARTPSAAKNFNRAHLQNQEVKEQSILFKKQKTDEKGRYNTRIDLDYDPQTRMSLSCFHEYSQALKQTTKGTKTEQQMMGLKLEGIQLKVSLGSARNRLRKSKKQETQNLYITQQAAKLSLLKPTLEDKSNTERFEKIIGRIQQQKQKEQERGRAKTQQWKKVKIQVGTNSQNKKEKIDTSRKRQKMHVNIINLMEQRCFKESKYKNKYHGLSARLGNQYHNIAAIRSHNSSHQEKQLDKTTERDLFSDFIKFEKQLEAVRKIPRDLKQLQEDKNSRTKSAKIEGKYFQSYQEEKLQQRKSIIKSYTFKKNEPLIKVEKPAVNEDFHVQGWNHSQQFERREVIMIV